MRSLFSFLVLFAFGLQPLFAQSALDGFDPNANGRVRAMVLQPDGKIVVGGAFTSVSPNGGAPVARNRLARFNSDGTLDSSFNPNANGEVLAVALQSDGKILAGGQFDLMGGQSRSRLARLNADGTLDAAFNPNANDSVFTIAVQPNGKILAGGFFTTIGGQTRNRLARLNSDGTPDNSFLPDVDNSVYSLVLQPDGRIVVGGAFNSIGGQVRNRLARLNPDGTLETAFNPDVNNWVLALALQPDGKIVMGGLFTSVAGQTRNRVARINLDGTLDPAFDPNANNTVTALVVEADGKILVGGFFDTLRGQVRGRLGRLNGNGSLVTSFNPNVNSFVYAVAVQPDGKIIAGGQFSSVAPNGGAAITRNNLARFERSGLLDRTLEIALDPNMPESVDAIAVQPDGKIVIGGDFTSVLGVTRNRIARLNADGTLDTSFNPNASAPVFGLALQPDGKILVTGDFLLMGGVLRPSMARLQTDGSLDNFYPTQSTTSGSVDCMVLQPDGKIVVGGSFESIGGRSSKGLARLNSDGSADSTFFNYSAFGGSVITTALQPDGKILIYGVLPGFSPNNSPALSRLSNNGTYESAFQPNANGEVTAINVQPDGKILAGGSFTSLGGQPRNRIARLNVNGTADSTYNPNSDGPVFTIVLQSDARAIVGGDFTGIGGSSRGRIARLNPEGTADATFDANANNIVLSAALQADGKVFAGGLFTNIGGQSRAHFARMTNPTPPVETLTATPSVITWTRGGSAPQLKSVTFESSTDNVNFTPLGSGTPSGSNWSLSGLSLPIGQNIYLRARGYYVDGYQNGSSSAIESVRNVFFAVPQLTFATSRKTHGAAGEFDLPLALSGSPTVEPRSSSGAHTLVLTFNNPLVSGNAAVTLGTGAIAGSPTFSGNSMIVNVTGVPDVHQFRVSVTDVTDINGQVTDSSVSMNVLAGDTNGSKTVSAADVSQTKAQAGASVTAANFRQDVTPTGSISAADISLVKSRSGQFVP